MTRNLVLLLASCTSTLASAIATKASAQAATATAAPPGAGASGQVLSEVVVTARGRNEQLQKAPVAVTAFSSQVIQDARIKDVSDFIALTPNVSIVEAQSVGYSAITIRGISQVRNGESPVSVVTDGVQQISPRQFTTDLFDVQQIEVLRGPQGALYGRDALGGAIIITTKQPTNTFHESVDAEAGNGDDYHVEASVAGPIIPDKLLFRLSGNYHDFGGLLTDVFLDKKADFEHDRAVHAQLKANVTNNFTIDLHANYDYSYGGGLNYQYQPAKFASPTSCFLDPTNPFGGPAPDANRVNRSFCAYDLGNDVRVIADVSARFQYTTPWATITDTMAAIHVAENLEGDQFPYSASINLFGLNGTQTGFEDRSAFQNDFRIASPDTGRFKWMVGAYVLHTTFFLDNTTGFDEGRGIIGVERQPQFNNPVNPTLSYLADNNNNIAYAFYGNVSYEIIDGLVADFGYRYDDDYRRENVSPLSTAGLPTGCSTTSGSGPCTLSHDFNHSQPKFTLSYQLNPELMLYADYGVGFRSGQFNQFGVAAAAAAAGTPGVTDLVRAEYADTGEGGFKSTLLNGKLHLNATGYYTKDSNPFYYLFVGSVGAQILVNIDQVNLYGAELEADYTPIRGLNLFANYGYTHSSIEKYALDPADVGNRAPLVPDQTGTFGAQYRRPITNQLGLFSRGEVELHGKQYWDPEDDTPRDAFALVNLQGGIEKIGGGWSITGFVKNLTDKAYNAEYVTGGFVQPAEPRTYGVELKANF